MLGKSADNTDKDSLSYRFFKHTWENSPWFQTWDYQWHYAITKQKGLSLVPNYNLVSNIGGCGTHAVEEMLCHQKNTGIPGILHHPAEVKIDYEADIYSCKKIYCGTWKDRIKYILHRLRLWNIVKKIMRKR